jgi:hypothetical protein
MRTQKGRRSFTLVCTLAAVLGTLAATGGRQAAPAAPISLHPANPHYFLWRGRPALLITSGEHYGAVLNRDFDYRKYLDTPHRRGHRPDGTDAAGDAPDRAEHRQQVGQDRRSASGRVDFQLPLRDAARDGRDELRAEQGHRR